MEQINKIEIVGLVGSVRSNMVSGNLVVEQINKIEIVGLVGSVRSNMVSGNLVVNFTVATTAAYKGRDGSAIMDTTCYPKTIVIKS